jgi:threonine/homoserine/homoserine lactone efflux protein
LTEIIPFLTAGFIFGLAAGMSPGPLLAVVISETLRHNRIEGIKVAITPLLTDLPIILFTFFILSRLANSNIALGIIAISGAIFLCYIGYECIRTKGIEINFQTLRPRSIKKGIIVNALSPHPYIFWLTVGTPTAIKAYQTSIPSLIIFVIAFYGLLVGSKIGIAIIVDKSRHFLSNKAYVWTMRTTGLILLGFAIYFFRDGLTHFGIM